MLRDANALRSGDANPIYHIDEAVRVLGTDEVRDAILSAPMIAKPSDRIAKEYVRVQRESVTIAALAQNLAASCPDETLHAPYETALLANIGRLALIELVRRKSLESSEYSQSDQLRDMIEALSKTDFAETRGTIGDGLGPAEGVR